MAIKNSLNLIISILDTKPLLEKSGGRNDEELEANWRPKLLGIFLSIFSCLGLLTLNTIVQKMKLHYADVLFVRAVLHL